MVTAALTRTEMRCSSGKNSYYSEAEALATAAHQEREGHAPPLSAYYCLECYSWHLTSRSGGPGGGKKRRKGR